MGALHRNELDELQPTVELCSYYRKRISEFETERDDMLERLENNSCSREELHKSQWELKKRIEEVKELQKALSDAHTYLFEERQRLLELQAENDELKLQELEDRKRIQHLLALTGPVEQEITYFRSKQTESLTHLPKDDKRNKGEAERGYVRVTGVPRPEPPHVHQPVQPCERVMRTVYLPTSNVESLLLKCESLQAQLNEQKRYSNERIAALLEDRRIREADEEAYRKTMERRVEDCTDKIQRSEKLLTNSTRDFVIAQKTSQEHERVKMEKAEEVRVERVKTERERNVLQQAQIEEIKNLETKMAREQAEFLKEYQTQIKGKAEELVNMESLHKAVMTQYENRIKDLDAQLGSLRGKHKALEARRLLDLEGFTRDVTLLRKQLCAVDRKLHQLRLANRLEDDERLDALLEHIEQRAPSPNASLQDDDASASSLEESVGSLVSGRTLSGSSGSRRSAKVTRGTKEHRAGSQVVGKRSARSGTRGRQPATSKTSAGGDGPAPLADDLKKIQEAIVMLENRVGIDPARGDGGCC
ncbi:hypothetical protein CYMTET_47438 [Cymbomonas tetramitiformis]|uniref:Coiled-coil domain-containing protein 77 n=1 Tax=Cymbomonas tetramitiformis TaxID=36881 RepID=A0AAE0BVR0_9CHLO|nr:hypothetical protein CYMTET_47438 [Cymbomonas tetramitiformis]